MSIHSSLLSFIVSIDFYLSIDKIAKTAALWYDWKKDNGGCKMNVIEILSQKGLKKLQAREMLVQIITEEAVPYRLSVKVWQNQAGLARCEAVKGDWEQKVTLSAGKKTYYGSVLRAEV